MTDKKPKAIEGEIIAKDVPLPMEQREKRGITKSFFKRAELYAEKKEVEAVTAVQNAYADLGDAVTRRAENQEKFVAQEAKISGDGLENIRKEATNSIVAKLEESKTRILTAEAGRTAAETAKVAAEAAKGRQAKLDQLESLKLDEQIEALNKKLKPKEQKPFEERKREFDDEAADFGREFKTAVDAVGGDRKNLPDHQRKKFNAWERRLNKMSNKLDAEAVNDDATEE